MYPHTWNTFIYRVQIWNFQVDPCLVLPLWNQHFSWPCIPTPISWLWWFILLDWGPFLGWDGGEDFGQNGSMDFLCHQSSLVTRMQQPLRILLSGCFRGRHSHGPLSIADPRFSDLKTKPSLVGGIPIPLKNIRARQLGWLSPMESDKNPWFQATNQIHILSLLNKAVKQSRDWLNSKGWSIYHDNYHISGPKPHPSGQIVQVPS